MKTINRICAAFLLTALCASAVGCGHTHEVTKWKVVRESTCTTEGLRRGACLECGEVLEEPVPVNPENHVYGEWVITKQPTSSRDGAGLAEKICRENEEHKISVTLPRLTQNGAGYESYEITKQPTVLKEGEVTAVFNDSVYGKISFIVPIDKKAFDFETSTVEDAVLIGASNRDLVRRGTIEEMNFFEVVGQERTASSLSYEYSDNYVHISSDDGRSDTWVSLTAKGDPFKVTRRLETSGYGANGAIYDEIIEKSANARKEDLGGYEYKSSLLGRSFFGAEGLLQSSYEWGARDGNRDFRESIGETADGRKLYKYQFGVYDPPTRFSIVKVEFTLTDDYAVDYIRLGVEMYVNRKDIGSDGNLIEINQFEVSLDANDVPICSLLPGCGSPYNDEYIIYEQTMKTEDPVEPVREYTEEAFQISNIDVVYNRKTVVTEDKATAPSVQSNGKALSLTLRNIEPSTASFSFDPVELYRITDTGRIVSLGFSGDVGVEVWYTLSGNNLTIRTRYVGYITLMLRTESGYERTFVINSLAATPNFLYPSANEYNDAGYAWKTTSEDHLSTEVYVGQSVTLSASVATEEKAYVDGSYVATVDSATDGGSLESASVTEIADSQNVRFVAEKAGTYVVKMTSLKNDLVYATVTVTVTEPPSMQTLLSGDYEGCFKKFDATVSFEKFSSDGTVRVTVTTDKGYEILTVSYDEQNRILVCEHTDGATLGVKLELNEAYRLELVNPTGFGSGRERAVLFRAEAEEGTEANG